MRSTLCQGTKTGIPGVGRRGAHVLLVDDEATFAMMGKKILTKVGFFVTAMTDAGEALYRFQADPGKFDVVIADKTMPKLSGYTLARKFQEIRPGIPVVIACGSDEATETNAVESAGVSAYAKKPISVSELVRILDRVLDEARKA